MGDPPATGPPSYGGSKGSKHTKHSSKSSNKPNRWHEVFDYMLNEVMALSKQSTLYTMLVDHGYKDAPLAIHKLSNEEIANMSIFVKGRHRPILLADRTHLRIWQAFVHDMSIQGYTLSKPRHVMKLKRKNYRNFQHYVYPHKYGAPPVAHQNRSEEPTSPIATQPTSPIATHHPSTVSKTPADLFKKGVTRDPASFPILVKDTSFEPWSRSLTAAAIAQGLGNVLNPKYKPSTHDEITLFALQKDFMHSVFHNILKTDVGKDLLRKHEPTRDAQALHSELLTFYQTGNMGADQTSEWITYLTTTRANDGKWDGTHHGYILHFLDIVSKYNSYCGDPNDRMTDHMTMILLQAAVSPVEALHMVRSRATQDAIIHNIKPTFSHYTEALKFAAQDLDRRTRPTAKHALNTVCQTELTSGIDAAQHPTNDTAPRIPDNQWNSMTWTQRKEWMGLSPHTRALLLGTVYKETHHPTPDVLPPDDQWNQMTRAQRNEWMRLSPDTRTLLLGADQHTVQAHQQITCHVSSTPKTKPHPQTTTSIPQKTRKNGEHEESDSPPDTAPRTNGEHGEFTPPLDTGPRGNGEHKKHTTAGQHTAPTAPSARPPGDNPTKEPSSHQCNVLHSLNALMHDQHRMTYHSDLHIDPKRPNLHLDLPSGEDFQGGKKFVKIPSTSKQNSFSDDTLKADQNKRPVDKIIDMTDEPIHRLINSTDRTLLTEQPNGEKSWSNALQTIQDRTTEMQNNTTKTQFRLEVKNTDFEKPMSCQETAAHISRNHTINVLWERENMTGHQGPLSPRHKDLKTSSCDSEAEWGDRNVPTIPHNLIAADELHAEQIHHTAKTFIRIRQRHFLITQLTLVTPEVRVAIICCTSQSS